METRVEKRKRERRENRIKFYKLIILLSTLLVLYIGLKVVNANIIYLDYLKNPKIFNLNIRESKIDLFGETYFIDFKILKKSP
ncbi:MAG: hypothetical protein GX981_04365 [Tissierellia bacterium]|nr:hypothetical protein [Tissierellia bacterium]